VGAKHITRWLLVSLLACPEYACRCCCQLEGCKHMSWTAGWLITPAAAICLHMCVRALRVGVVRVCDHAFDCGVAALGDPSSHLLVRTWYAQHIHQGSVQGGRGLAGCGPTPTGFQTQSNTGVVKAAAAAACPPPTSFRWSGWGMGRQRVLVQQCRWGTFVWGCQR
jgi:hypothetical protein